MELTTKPNWARQPQQLAMLGDCSLTDNRGRCACTTSTCGAGMLDADQALRFAASPAGYVAPVTAALTLSDDRLKACAVILGRPVPIEPLPPAEEAPPPSGGEGGGGAMSAFWVAMLGVAAVAVRRRSAAPLTPR